jgi:flagellar basal-body rod protein FlgG
MLGVFRTAASGMAAQQQLIDVVSNNLANMNTPGFRASQARFHDLLYQRAPVAGELVANDGEAPPSPGSSPAMQDLIGSGVRLAATSRSFEPGQIVVDDDPLHMAIEGEGFFVVQSDDGGAAYTRDGSFTVDAVGRLVTAGGQIVLPETRIPADAHDVRVDAQGLIFARLGGASGDEDVEVQVGEVQLARFTNPHGLVSVGGNVYLASENSGPALIGYPGDEGYGTVLGGAVEGSNVDTAEQMTQMIMGQRAYAFNARALQTMDEMLSLANNLRR